MSKSKAWVSLAAMAGLALGTGGAIAGQAAQSGAKRSIDLPAVNMVQKGKWVLRNSEGKEETLCLRDSYQLLRLNHSELACQPLVLESAASRATVRQSCAGHGTVLTRLVVDTPRSLSIDTQGVVDGLPFSETFDARRVGDCA